MRKLINLIALVMLVSTNVLTPFSYAQVDDIVEMDLTNAEISTDLGQTQGEVLEKTQESEEKELDDNNSETGDGEIEKKTENVPELNQETVADDSDSGKGEDKSGDKAGEESNEVNKNSLDAQMVDEKKTTIEKDELDNIQNQDEDGQNPVLKKQNTDMKDEDALLQNESNIQTMDVQPGTSATLLPGKEFNSKIKTLAGGGGWYYSSNYSIQKIERSDTPAPSGKEIKVISTSTSQEEIVAWYENRTIYYYTEAETIYMNEDSSHMFYYMEGLTSLDLNNFNTSKVTDMSYMFFYCISLTELDLSDWNTSNVTNMSYMFFYCRSLTELDLSDWNTSNVTNMSSMFNGCSSLTSLDLSNFNTSNVIRMTGMFKRCRDLQTIRVSDDFVVKSITNTEMFRGDTNLVGGNGTVYNMDIFGKWARIDMIGRPGYFSTRIKEVRFDSKGGTPVSSQTIQGNSYRVQKPEAPYREGRDFIGWYTYDGEKWDFSRNVSNFLILYAHYACSEGTYEVGDKCVESQEIDDSKIIKISNGNETVYIKDVNEGTTEEEREVYQIMAQISNLSTECSINPENCYVALTEENLNKVYNYLDSIGLEKVKYYLMINLYGFDIAEECNKDETCIENKQVEYANSIIGEEFADMNALMEYLGDAGMQYLIWVNELQSKINGNFYFWGNNSGVNYSELEFEDYYNPSKIINFDNLASNKGFDGGKYGTEAGMGWKQGNTGNPCDSSKGEYLPTVDDWNKLLRIYYNVQDVNIEDGREIYNIFKASSESDDVDAVGTLRENGDRIYRYFDSIGLENVKYYRMTSLYEIELEQECSNNENESCTEEIIEGKIFEYIKSIVGEEFEDLVEAENYMLRAIEAFQSWYNLFEDEENEAQSITNVHFILDTILPPTGVITKDDDKIMIDKIGEIGVSLWGGMNEDGQIGYFADGEIKYIDEESDINNLAMPVRCFIKSRTISFDTDGGTRIEPIELIGDQEFNMPADPTKTNYTFEGWYTDRELTNIFTLSTPVTGNLTLYAKWTQGQPSTPSYSGGGGGGGGGGGNSNPNTPKPEETPQDDNQQKPDLESPRDNTQNSSNETPDSQSNDNSYTSEQKEAYEFAHDNGITTMPTIQKANIDGKLTRIQMAKMLSQYAINVLGKAPDTSKMVKFKDVSSKMNADYDNGVILAYQLGIMGQNMKNNKFRPNDEVTRAEFVTALSRLLYSTSDGEYKSTSKYYIHHMEKLKAEGIVTNDDPKMKERRGYVMIMLMRSAK